jgi:hypothetical protein
MEKTTPNNKPVFQPQTKTQTGYTTRSIDPVVADVHAIRAKEWDKYGSNTQAWFDALLHHQALRTEQNAVR